ncbi:MAG: alpha/beta fold hydrolase [bacterium]
MKLKVILYLIFLLFIALAVPININASDNLIKNENNPIKFSSEGLGFNEIGQRQSSLLFENDVYKLWYASISMDQKFKIAYAESDNLFNFKTKEIIDLNYDQEYDFHDPQVLKINDKYVLFFAVSKNGTDYKILRAESIDGINFGIITEIINSDKTWEQKAVSAPTVIFENSKYYLFYTGWYGSKWQIGLAISDDSVSWTKCDNNPIVTSASGPHIFKEPDKYKLHFHDSSASKLSFVETSDSLSCSSNWQNRQDVLFKDQSYDFKAITDPSLININNVTYLIYSGLSESLNWTLNIANTDIPIIKEKFVVLIPGFMTSWNHNAMVYNDQSLYSDWQILDFIKEYSGIIKTFENIGFKKNEKIFIFAYDWRKSVENLQEDLNNFINKKIYSVNQNPDIFIIGHSFGGLIGRIYLQNNPDKISKLLTVGSPHKGTAQVYKALEAGVIEQSNELLTLSQNLIINLNKDLTQSDRDVVTTLFPSLLDIFPVYDFLKDSNGLLIDYKNLNIKNTLLNKYEDITLISDKLLSLYSDSEQSLFGFNVTEPNQIEKLFSYYPDGYPLEKIYDVGDKNLLALSTNVGNNSYKINGDHEELIYKKNSIKKIFDLLNFNYKDEDIVEGEKTIVNPSLIFIMKSPATIEASFNDKVYFENNGLIFIPNATSGKYKLKAQGKDYGKYTILIGQISQNNEIWENIFGEILENPPTNQIDYFEIDFNSQNAKSIYTAVNVTITPAIVNNYYSTENTNSDSSESDLNENQEIVLPNVLEKLQEINNEPKNILGVSQKKDNSTKIKKSSLQKEQNMQALLAKISSILISFVGYIFRKRISKN